MSIKKLIVLLLIPLTLNLFTASSFAFVDSPESSDKSTFFEPQSNFGNVEDISETREEGWFSRNKWWILGGVLILAGAAAAAGGGGGGGGSSTPEAPSTGSATVTW